MKHSLQFGRFDLQVRLVLILLVLFLGILNLMNVFLLGRARRTMERSELNRIEAVSRQLVTELGRRALLNGLTAADRFALPGELILRRAALRAGFDRIRLLDRHGTELASSRSKGTTDPSPFEALSKDEKTALASGRLMTLRCEPARVSRKERIAGFVPLLDVEARLVGVVEVLHPVPELAAMESRFRTVVVVQVVGVVVIAGVVLFFASWVSGPYRRIAAVAGEAGLTGAAGGSGPEPDELAAAFRTVVVKMREQDEALRNLDRGGGGLGDLVRFASRSASEMTTGVLVLDRRTEVAAMNEAAAAQLGVERNDVRGLGLGEIDSGVPGLVELVRACLEKGRGVSREVLEVSRGAGGRGHLGVGLTPSFGTDGKPVGVLVLMTDLTEIRELQEQARLRENLAAVGQLSAGIAHEFRNALGTILGYARMLEKREDARVRGPAREILKEVDTVRRSIDEFLLFARPPEPDSTVLQLERLIRACAATVPERINVDIDGEYGPVVADEGLLRRVFDNLLGNATDAASEAERTVSVRIRGRIAAGGRTIQVEVEDDGPGISGEQLEQVFVPFFTTRKSGTGLGLALVQRTMVDLGGTVEAAQGPRGGALFRLRFPVAT